LSKEGSGIQYETLVAQNKKKKVNRSSSGREQQKIVAYPEKKRHPGSIYEKLLEARKMKEDLDLLNMKN